MPCSFLVAYASAKHGIAIEHIRRLASGLRQVALQFRGGKLDNHRMRPPHCCHASIVYAVCMAASPRRATSSAFWLW